jgi:hypothetical protein
VNLADTPATWPDSPSLSILQALLLFAGSTILIIAIITMLVMAPSLAKGPRYRPSQQWDADAVWFGAVPAASSAHPAIEAAQADAGPRLSDDSGGASASW